MVSKPKPGSKAGGAATNAASSTKRKRKGANDDDSDQESGLYGSESDASDDDTPKRSKQNDDDDRSIAKQNKCAEQRIFDEKEESLFDKEAAEFMEDDANFLEHESEAARMPMQLVNGSELSAYTDSEALPSGFFWNTEAVKDAVTVYRSVLPKVKRRTDVPNGNALHTELRGLLSCADELLQLMANPGTQRKSVVRRRAISSFP